MNRLTFAYDPEVLKERDAVWANVELFRAEWFTDDVSARAARFLLLSAIFGTDADVIGKLAGCSREEGRSFGQLARKNGIWVCGKIDCQWFDEDNFTGLTALLLDVLCLLGLVAKKKEETLPTGCGQPV